MKKLHIKDFVCGMVVMALIVSLVGTALATVASKTATLSYNNIKITLNGNAITPKDSNGNTVEPFIIGGTTYLPVRAVANALGINVGWDSTTKTVQLTDDSTSTSSGTLLADTNGIKIYYKSLTKASYGDNYNINIYIENNTNTDYTVQDRNLSINDYMTDSSFSCDVAAGKKANDSIIVYGSSLTENGITALKTGELYFTIFKTDTLTNNIDTPTVSIDF